ncbi:hypothetical protein RJ641_008792 [Dillenia turbinata]|uniref:C2H2-type domain-containing protein n=1 Tax=Dillenia turbinata TaxID=194707 RepID=A0AAN8VGA2_9MAGN
MRSLIFHGMRTDKSGHHDDHRQLPTTKKRKHSLFSPSSSSHFKPHKALSSSWSYLKSVFSSKTCKTIDDTQLATPTSVRSSQHSLVTLVPSEVHVSSTQQRRRPTESRAAESDISAESAFLPLRNDIFPCTACGEIFPKSQLLEQHQSIKHAVSELIDGDSGNNIVRIIFNTGWTNTGKTPRIHRILKIHNSPRILSRFEENREIVKSKASGNSVMKRDERCVVDGNELLRFHCSTFSCNLGHNGNSSICNNQYCSVCGIIGSGFSPKLDGISTLSTSWRAHVVIPDEIEEEFAFMNVKRAMLVCRVVAGRIGYDSMDVDKEDCGFDSVAGRGSGTQMSKVDEDELLVFNPRAVLPCFVIVYSV